MFLHRLAKVKAPEIPPGMLWLNSKPQTMKGNLGKVILIDFWTYSCINCIRTIPHLREWQEKYGKYGFEIIGVHTPEFAFEKDEENVQKALKELDIKYTVVLDSDYKIWNLYANRWWPRKFLIDATGSIVYDHIGEGGYAETESAIQKALMEIGVLNLPPIAPDLSVGGGICYRTTPETYLGFLRGRYGNAKDFIPNTEQAFTDVAEHDDDIIYLHGHWVVAGEKVVHAKKLSTATEYMALKYSAFSVNLVAGSTNGEPAELEVQLDGQALPEDMAGEDVTIKDGKAVVKIKKSKMYRLIDSDTYHKGLLKLKTSSDNVEMYAFTFGGCKGM